MIRISALVSSFAAVVSAALSVVPVAAEDVPTVKFRYADLDLATPAGAKMLQHRVARAVTAVCGIPAVNDLDAVRAATICRKHAVDSSSPQVAAAIDKAVQVALATSPKIASR